MIEQKQTESTPVTIQGLSSAEVVRLTSEGKSNAGAGVKTKTFGQIVRTHTLTLFNIVNLILAIIVISTGSIRNLLFIFVVIFNTVISIVQEYRSKKLVDKLAILAAKDVRVVRDGVECDVPAEQIVLGDIILLGHGDQVPADCEVIEGIVHMHEGLLTGESVPVEHAVGEELLSGSFVDSGFCHARIVRVGSDSFASKMTAEAKQAKIVRSEIMDTLSTIIRFSTTLLVPVGVALFARSIMDGNNYSDAALSTVAALVGMIPQGLVLLTSSVLAIAMQRLANRKVLVQQLYCIEELARVDTLCLDKTGTITTGRMKVDRIEGLGEDDRHGAAVIAATVAEATRKDANATTSAILAYVKQYGIHVEPIARTINFSSARKYSGCVTESGLSFAMGAAQFVLGDGWKRFEGKLRSYGPEERVLVLANVEGFDDEDNIIGEAGCVGFIALSDEVRNTAQHTMEYFTAQGVNLKVISGDDPATVSAIAGVAHVPNSAKWVDASTLKTDEDVAKAASRYTVFGRVTPQQKRSLVHALQAEGHAVAMTGDGVNDVLALHDADCAVAMASGSDAARTVADIVLVDDDFAHMPEVVAEGRRSINNLQRSAALFLVKTVWSIFVALFSVLVPPFPMQPIQMSLVSGLTIGIPSFVLALEPNRELIRGSFLENVLTSSLPASVAISVGVAAVSGIGGLLGIPMSELSCLCMLLVYLVGYAMIIRISCKPWSPVRIALALFIPAALVACWIVLPKLFMFVPLSPAGITLLVICTFVCTLLFLALYQLSTRGGKGAQAVANIFRKWEAKDGKRSI